MTKLKWSFLKAIMNEIGFCEKWINWIMTCFSTVYYAFNINGEKLGRVKPGKGIRQGDPLSHYLFLVCAEGFSNLLKQTTIRNKIIGVKISRDGPFVSHLFFVDDTVIFCNATLMDANEVLGVLRK
ncbi:hypothetical protein ACH5RR_023209 [Cinchona calisaya]|uniref:Reverse transcriptase domain-containing protein n=1 Tax=Cinchona calisaya TaxID=153742 RepID=A0ABD2ZD58_9GENT